MGGGETVLETNLLYSTERESGGWLRDCTRQTYIAHTEREREVGGGETALDKLI